METKEIKQILENSPKLRKDLKIARFTNKTNISILESECKLIELSIKDKLALEMEKDKTKYSNAEKRSAYLDSQLVLNEDYQKKIKEIEQLKNQIEMQDIELSYSRDMFEACVAMCYAGKEMLQ